MGVPIAVDTYLLKRWDEGSSISRKMLLAMMVLNRRELEKEGQFRPDRFLDHEIDPMDYFLENHKDAEKFRFLMLGKNL